MYINRQIDSELLKWMKSANRKPLLLRGARQVGKSSAVIELGKSFNNFVSINFEKQKDLHAFFDKDLDPHRICRELSIVLDQPIVPGKTLLFFDEIQACLPAISSLRYFYEEFSELHLIAAGSLLEFALEELPSFGVGRIRSLFVYPLSFNEFLLANGEERLLSAKQQANPKQPLALPIHEKLLSYFKLFLVLGGMPEVVSTYVENKDLAACQNVLTDLIYSIQSDFSKYKARVPSSRIHEVFQSVVHQAGGQFVYSKATQNANNEQIKEALNLLIMAGLVIPVTASSANGIPLGAQINLKKRKMLLLDTGIFQHILGLKFSEILFAKEFDLVNKGCIAEQYAGLEILKSASCYQQEDLYFWHREALNSNAEVDYVVQQNENIIPIEIKSGKQGSMQSLFRFLDEKKKTKGIRSSLENFGNYERIDVYPLYAIADIRNNTI